MIFVCYFSTNWINWNEIQWCLSVGVFFLLFRFSVSDGSITQFWYLLVFWTVKIEALYRDEIFPPNDPVSTEENKYNSSNLLYETKTEFNMSMSKTIITIIIKFNQIGFLLTVISITSWTTDYYCDVLLGWTELNKIIIVFRRKRIIPQVWVDEYRQLQLGWESFPLYSRKQPESI